MRVSSTLILPALLFTLSPTAATACSCMLAKLFSEKLPDRSDRTFAVFVAEVIRFDPVSQPPPATAERARESGGVYDRPNRVVGNRAVNSPNEFSPDLNSRVILRVIEFFSGPDVIPTEVWTHGQSSACGFAFVVGKKYLIDAQFFPPNQPRWTVTKCSRTAELGTGTADENLRVLHLWKSGIRPPAWITGQMFGYNHESQIAGVRLQLTDGSATWFAQSGSDGVFQLANLKPGTYTLTADIPGTRNRLTVDLRDEWSASPIFYIGFPN